MNSRHSPKIFEPVFITATQNFRDHQELEQSRIGRKVRNSDRQLAKSILDTANKLDSVEDMVAFELSLQELDLLKAKSDADRNSIIAARQGYEQFAVTIEQLQKNTAGYFLMNIGNKESRGDPHRIVKSNSLDFITGNVVRMQNRKQFAPEGESGVWDARIALADKTADMFKTLHAGRAADFARNRGDAAGE